MGVVGSAGGWGGARGDWAGLVLGELFFLELEGFEAEVDLEEVAEVADFGGRIVGEVEEADLEEAGGRVFEGGGIGGGRLVGFGGEFGGQGLVFGLEVFALAAGGEAAEAGDAGVEAPAALGDRKGEGGLDVAEAVFLEEFVEGFLLVGRELVEGAFVLFVLGGAFGEALGDDGGEAGRVGEEEGRGGWLAGGWTAGCTGGCTARCAGAGKLGNGLGLSSLHLAE